MNLYFFILVFALSATTAQAAKREWAFQAGPSMHLTNHGCDWLVLDCDGAPDFAGPAFGGVGEVLYGLGHTLDVGVRVQSFYQSVFAPDQTIVEGPSTFSGDQQHGALFVGVQAIGNWALVPGYNFEPLLSFGAGFEVEHVGSPVLLNANGAIIKDDIDSYFSVRPTASIGFDIRYRFWDSFGVTVGARYSVTFLSELKRSTLTFPLVFRQGWL